MEYRCQALPGLFGALIFCPQLSSAKTKGLDPSLLDDQRFIFKSR